MSDEIEYIEPTQEHVGQMVEVRDRHSEWREAFFHGIVEHEYKFVANEITSVPVGWTHARIPRPLTYAERQVRCGLKVGDRVRIVRAYEKYEQGYWCGFFDSMKTDIGLVGTIQKFDFRPQPCVYIAESNYVWPYFVLEKVEDRKATRDDIGGQVYVDGAPGDVFRIEVIYGIEGDVWRAVVVNNDKRFVYELSNLRVKE